MKRFLYQLKWRRYHPAAFARFEELMRNERLSLDELMAKQEIARQKIVCHAMEHTAFYKKFYGDVGFEIGDIGKDGWFERLPVVTKRELRERFDEFVDPEQRQFLRISTTGGSTGTLSPIAYNWYHCDPHPTHPLTGVKFGGAVHPHWEAMKAAAIKYAAKVPDMNMLSWDMLADTDGNIKILEVNASSQSSDWLQFAYGPLFADETENVVEWCASHCQYDWFTHLRTFY